MPARAYDRNVFLGRHGNVVGDRGLLTSARARAVADFARSYPEMRIEVLEMRQGRVDYCDGTPCSSLVLRIGVDVGPEPPVDIRQIEDLLVVFHEPDDRWPTVYALRDDFPDVLHVNGSCGEEYPASLCLSETAWGEVQIDWTAAYFLELLHVWLGQTARGTLHRAGQPVEAFIVAAYATLVVPHRLFSSEVDASDTFVIVGADEHVLRLVPTGSGGERDVAVLLVSTPPRTHGNQSRYPYTLAVLNETISIGGYELLVDLKAQLHRLRSRPALATERALLVLQIPVKRTDGGPIERYDVHAFLLGGSVLDLGHKLGVWDRAQPQGMLLGAVTADSRILVTPLNVQQTLSARSAVRLNGLRDHDELRFSAVGAGALGSQVLVDLSRAGMRPRLVVDADHLLPHNLARHALFSDSVGEPKARAMAAALNSILDEPPSVVGSDADMLDPRSRNRAEIFREVDVVLDMSASVAVSRYLATFDDSATRRISAFLSPSGHDLVILAEDRERAQRLDALEMHYYWEVAIKDALRDHFNAPEGERYGVSCRDVSSLIPQSSVAVHAGNAARALASAMRTDRATACVWSFDSQTGEMSRVVLETTPMQFVRIGDWTVGISERLMCELAAERLKQLPKETGGLLIGRYDHLHRHVYVVGVLPAPSDSVAWPTGFIRGVEGLPAQLERLT
ncbi:MAG TPA: ThiF family adenylyltransferase, partial [Candidatus Acidoferrales bacterium]|nr:ThiF family adenylyltransferase [Candidatus Acidoferrales bacterium]